jgi:hypothetical protein
VRAGPGRGQGQSHDEGLSNCPAHREGRTVAFAIEAFGELLSSRTVSRLPLLLCAMVAVGCGTPSDVNGFPAAYAAALCHFAYHCCTPTDRAVFSGGLSTYTTQLGFDDEAGCVQKLGNAEEVYFQPHQASAKDKRLVWDNAAAQACLNALADAAKRCDPQVYQNALSGDPNTPTVPRVCPSPGGFPDHVPMVTGLVGSGGVCTMVDDCAGSGSFCTPVIPDAGVLIQSGGTCVDLPTAGKPCLGSQCAPATSCCSTTRNVCNGYVPRGATCTGPNDFVPCGEPPCAPTDFCGWTGNANTCQAKLGGGQPCGVDMAGRPINQSCVSDNCDANNTCRDPGNGQSIAVCRGNPDGF